MLYLSLFSLYSQFRRTFFGASVRYVMEEERVLEILPNILQKSDFVYPETQSLPRAAHFLILPWSQVHLMIAA